MPGPYNPITDLYDVQAKDAHAWVQVWFPGYGWQNFDPTADVPLANPSPGSVLASTAGRTLAHLPWIPIGIVVAVVAAWRRGPPAPAPAAAHLGPPDRRRPRAGRGPARPSAPGRRDPVRLRRSAGRGDDPIRHRPDRLDRSWSSATPTAGLEPSADQIAAALAFTRGFRLARPAKARRPTGGQDREHGQCLVERGPGGQQRAVGHELPRAG